jgi:hypothetical protein
MKLKILCFFAFCIFSGACQKENPDVDPPVQETHFSILPGSSNFLSFYHDRDSVVFEDSLGNSLVLTVKASLGINKTHSSYYYNVHVPGDTVIIESTYTYDYISLSDEEKKYSFNLYLEPVIYLMAPDFDHFNTVDALIIFLRQPLASIGEYSVFQKVIDLREYAEAKPFWDINITDQSRTFWGTTFFEVQYTDYHNPSAMVYFNKTHGIVAFSDYDHKLWRLKL